MTGLLLIMLVFAAACALIAFGYGLCYLRLLAARDERDQERQKNLDAQACYLALEQHTDQLRVQLGLRAGREAVEQLRTHAPRKDGLPDA